MENGSGLGGSHRRGGWGRRCSTAEESGRGAVILMSEAGGLSDGRTGEVAVCLSSGEKEWSGKGERDGGWRF
jgi:hypothetical protein